MPLASQVASAYAPDSASNIVFEPTSGAAPEPANPASSTVLPASKSVSHAASAADASPAHQGQDSRESANEQQENPASPAAWEPRVKPVDAYDAGVKLGFTSMPSRTLKKSKSLTKAKGWPGVGKARGSRAAGASDSAPPSAAHQHAESAAPASAPGFAAAEPSPEASAARASVEAPAAPEVAQGGAQAVADAAAAPEPAAPARPNPFAQRSMPKGIGSPAAAQPSSTSAAPAAHSSAEEMPIEDIFGIFGVSMQDVVEER